MSDLVRTWISKTLLERVATAVEGAAAHRRSLAQNGVAGEDVNVIDAARQMERDARELRECASHQPPRATAGEQVATIEALVEELEKEGLPRTFHHVTPADNLRSMFRHAMGQRQEAFQAWGVLVDEQRVNLRAIKLMAERALQQPTHRRKDATLYVLLDTLENMVVDLMEIDTDEPDRYVSWRDDRQSSWEFRRLVAENRKLQTRIKALEAGAPETAEGVTDGDEESPF